MMLASWRVYRRRGKGWDSNISEFHITNCTPQLLLEYNVDGGEGGGIGPSIAASGAG